MMHAHFPPTSVFDWCALGYVVIGTIGCVFLVGYLIWAMWSSR